MFDFELQRLEIGGSNVEKASRELCKIQLSYITFIISSFLPLLAEYL